MSSVRTPLVAARRSFQNSRIQQGVQSGQITKQEAQALKAQRQELNDLAKAARADGKVTMAERRELHQAMNEMSKDIFEAKHNDQTRQSTPGVDQRQRRQTGRIAQGIASGELTGAEVRELLSDRRDIRQAERAAKADGVVTAEERQELQGMLNDLSQNIHEMKHDCDRRRFSLLRA